MDKEVFENEVEEPQIIPIKLNIIVTEKYNKPCIELRKGISDKELIKIILSAAFRGQQVICQPIFNDEIKALNSLINKGIIYMDQEERQYKYII